MTVRTDSQDLLKLSASYASIPELQERLSKCLNQTTGQTWNQGQGYFDLPSNRV